MDLNELVHRLISESSKGEPVSRNDIAKVRRRVKAGTDTAAALEDLDEAEKDLEPVEPKLKRELKKIRKALTKKGGRKTRHRKTRRLA